MALGIDAAVGAVEGCRGVPGLPATIAAAAAMPHTGYVVTYTPGERKGLGPLRPPRWSRGPTQR